MFDRCSAGSVTNQSKSTFEPQSINLLRALAILLITAAVSSSLKAQTSSKAQGQLAIDVTNIVTPVSPTLYGLMTEEINHSYDGGLYAEMIQNRAFHSDWQGEPPWDLVRHGNCRRHPVRSINQPDRARRLSLQHEALRHRSVQRQSAGLTNPGYWGYGVRPNTTYSGSLYARVENPDIGPITVQMINNATGAVQAQAQVTIQPGPWKRYEYKLTTGAISPSIANHLEFTVSHPGTVWLQLVSLMPPTFNNRPNGNRPDLMNRMIAMHPKFLRLPGGNFLEGMTLADWYDWKKTIGPLVDRPGHPSPWFYWSTDGLGLLEFLEWCEDLKVEPILAVYAGYSLGGAHVTGKDLEPYVQAALDEVEYVTGETSTKVGRRTRTQWTPGALPTALHRDRQRRLPRQIGQLSCPLCADC